MDDTGVGILGTPLFRSTIMFLGLPFEIWEIIAIIVHESQNKRVQGLNGPIFAQISQQFRAIAMQMPRLWSTIYFPGPKLRKGHLHIARVHVERSDSYPLSVTAYTVRFNADIMDLIIPLAPRWRYIDFRGPFKFFEALEATVKDRLQNLESCVVEVAFRKAFSARESPGPAFFPQEFLFLQNAVSLRHFFHHNAQHPYFLIPLSNLVSFHAAGFSESSLVNQECVPAPRKPIPTTCLSSTLVTLSCSIHPILSVAPILPNLRRLSLYIESLRYFSYYFAMVATLDRFFSKNGSGVENLTLLNARYVNPERPVGTLRRWLGYFPNVLVFTHFGYSSSNLLWPILTVRDPSNSTGGSNANVLPRLHTLRVVGEHQGSGSILIEMLASRGWVESQPAEGHSCIHSEEELQCLKAVYAGSVDEMDFEFFRQVNQRVSAYKRNGFSLATGVERHWTPTRFAKRCPLGGEMYVPAELTLP